MKQINEMTLYECLDALRQPRLGDYAVFTQQDRIEIADRIREITRWIPVSERMPNNDEVVLCRRVEGGMFGSREIEPQVGTFRNGSFDCVFNWIRVTHWRRII